MPHPPFSAKEFVAYLGDLEELLGDLNNIGQLLDVLDALLDGVGMVGTSGVQNVPLLLDLALSPLLVQRATVLGEGSKDAENREGDDGFLVEDVELIADSGNGKTGSSREDRGLGSHGLTGQGVEDRLGLLLRVLARDVRGRPGHGQVRGDGTDRQGRPQPGCT